MRIKSIIYSVLIVCLGLSLAFVIDSDKLEERKLRTNIAIEILESEKPSKQLQYYFTTSSNERLQQDGMIYKIVEKLGDKTYSLQSSPIKLYPELMDNLKSSLLEQVTFQDENIVSIDIVRTLFHNHNFYSIMGEYGSDSFDILREQQQGFINNLSGKRFGLEFLLRSVLILILLWLPFNQILATLKIKSNSFPTHFLFVFGLVISTRIIIVYEWTGTILPLSQILLPFTLLIIDLLLLSIPYCIYRIIEKRIKNRFEFIDELFFKGLIIAILSFIFLFSLDQIGAFLGGIYNRFDEALLYQAYIFLGISPQYFGILTFLTLIIVFMISSTFNYLKKEWLLNKTNKISKEMILNAEAKLNAIQSSVNPHFLYNSFNSIASLAKKDPSKTEKMTLALSSFYKYTTNRTGKPFSTIGDEIEMIINYLDIEKIRFEDRLKYDIDVNSELFEIKLPYFLLQPLVENAIKYGYNKVSDKIEIRILVERSVTSLTIKVFDNGDSFGEELKVGYGLRSISKKLNLLYPDMHEISFNNEPKHVCISLKTNYD